MYCGDVKVKEGEICLICKSKISIEIDKVYPVEDFLDRLKQNINSRPNYKLYNWLNSVNNQGKKP